jgi:hypothetical protein
MSGAIRLLPLYTLKAWTRPADKGSTSRCLTDSTGLQCRVFEPQASQGKEHQSHSKCAGIAQSLHWQRYGLRLPALQCLHQLWGPLRLLTNGHRRSFHGSKTARAWILPPISIWCQSKCAWSHSWCSFIKRWRYFNFVSASLILRK